MFPDLVPLNVASIPSALEKPITFSNIFFDSSLVNIGIDFTI
jgi:hypothetical protein